MAFPGAPDPLFRRMPYNRGVTAAVIGALLIVGGIAYTAYTEMQPKEAVPPPSQASLDTPGLNNEDEFHRRVDELNKTAPGGSGQIPYGVPVILVGAAGLGIGIYQMRMARS